MGIFQALQYGPLDPVLVLVEVTLACGLHMIHVHGFYVSHSCSDGTQRGLVHLRDIICIPHLGISKNQGPIFRPQVIQPLLWTPTNRTPNLQKQLWVL